MLIKDHHPGYIDWPTFEASQQRMGANTQPRRIPTLVQFAKEPHYFRVLPAVVIADDGCAPTIAAVTWHPAIIVLAKSLSKDGAFIA